jgi:Mitochondrial K+-H+ exchange-related
MRLFLLPISTRRALIYCQRLNQKPSTELSLVQKSINKVPQTWAKWETAESGWKKALTEYGNRGLQRIPYQEWGLKSFPPLSDQIQAEELSNNKKFDVIFPANIVQREDVPKIMRRLASERKQLHWKRFIWSLIGIPFTIPFGLIPVSVSFDDF